MSIAIALRGKDMSFRGFFGFIALAISAPALGQVSDLYQFGYKDWAVVENLLDSFLEVPTCVAYTKQGEGREKVQLNLHFPKDFLKAPIATIQLGAQLRGNSIEVELGPQNKSLALPLENRASAENAPYWYIPLQMDQLMEFVVKENNLIFYIRDSQSEERVRLSLAGSGRVLQNTLMGCLNQNEYFDEQFFVELMDPKVPRPLSASQSTTEAMRVFQESYKSYLFLRNVQDQLDQLVERFEPDLKIETQSRKLHQEIIEKVRKNEVRISSLNKEEEVLRKILKSYEPLRKNLLDEKYKYQSEKRSLDESFLPVEKQVKSLSVRIQNEVSLLSELQYEVSNAQKLKTQIQTRLVELSNEQGLLNQRLVSLKSHRDQLSQNENRLQNQLNSIDTSSETRKRLEGHREFQGLLADATGLKSQIPPLEEQVKVAQTNRLISQRNFEACRQVHLTDLLAKCGSEMSALQNSQEKFSVLQNKMRDLSDKIFSLENKAREIEASIRHQVLSERRSVQSDLQQLQVQIYQAKKRIESYGERTLRIVQIEIPQQEAEERSLETKILGLGTEQLAASSRRKELEKEKDELQRSSGYFDLLSERKKLSSQVLKLQIELRSIEKATKETDSRFAEIMSLRSQAQATNQQDLASLKQAESDWLAAQVRLKEYRVQEKQLQFDYKNIKAKYLELRGRHQAFVRQAFD